MIGAEEFALLARRLEPVRLPPEQAAILFKKMSCVPGGISGRRKLISLRRFAIACMENGLYTPSSQRHFLEVPHKEPECRLLLKSILDHGTDRIVAERLGQTTIAGWLQPITGKESRVLLIRFSLLEAESVFLWTEYREEERICRKQAREIMGPLYVFAR